MTKEKIIEMICATWIKDENGIPFILDYNAIADTLLALINKELSERLEKLHTEMDERMREEVAIEKRMGEKKAENAKKEVAREILKNLYDEAISQQGEVVELTAYYIKNTLAKEYGVEL